MDINMITHWKPKNTWGWIEWERMCALAAKDNALSKNGVSAQIWV